MALSDDMTGGESGQELEPLMTVCPRCARRFRVTEAQLQAARGRVRCGGCNTVFDGVDHLVLDMPRAFDSRLDAEQALDALMAELMEEMRAPPAAQPQDSGAAFTVVSAPAPGPEPVPECVPGPGTAPAVAPELAPGAVAVAEAEDADQAPADPDASVPFSASRPADAPPDTNPFADAVLFGPPPRRRPWRLVAAITLAAFVAAGSWLWIRFDELVRDPGWRPVYAGICKWTGCTLPVLRDLDQIRTRNLVVQAAPDVPGRLRVRAVIANEAAFPQPFPALELRFTALNGTLVAGHRFQPADYLAGEASRLEAMPPGIPVQLELSVPDPGEVAVSYQLRYR